MGHRYYCGLDYNKNTFTVLEFSNFTIFDPQKMFYNFFLEK